MAGIPLTEKKQVSKIQSFKVSKFHIFKVSKFPNCKVHIFKNLGTRIVNKLKFEIIRFPEILFTRGFSFLGFVKVSWCLQNQEGLVLGVMVAFARSENNENCYFRRFPQHEFQKLVVPNAAE